MTPWRPGRAAKYPILIASRARSWLDWKRLDVGQRMRIKATRHDRGMYFAPVKPDDAWAIEWIDKLAARYGVLRWRHATKGWTVEKKGKVT